MRNKLYLFIAFLILTGCSSSEKKIDTSETEYEIPPDPGQQQKIDQVVHVVEIKQMQFQPGEIRVHTGDKVVWVNRDIVEHDVTELTSKAWASAPIPAGASWSMTITESADYFCNLHQVMKGKIVVIQ